MQTRVKFAALGRRWSRLKFISCGKNSRPTASGSHSRARQLAITFGLVRRTWSSLHSLAFASLRVMYYYFNLSFMRFHASSYFSDISSVLLYYISSTISGGTTHSSIKQTKWKRRFKWVLCCFLWASNAICRRYTHRYYVYLINKT